jgi:hypothetical protein
MKNRTESTPERRPREEGSAYLIALLGLVVLTVLGLALSLVTQTEMKLGANERTLQRIFYAADAGFSSAVSRAMVQADFQGRVFELPDYGSSAAFNYRHNVDVSAFFPLLTAPCNLCQINNAGTYGTKQYFKISHAVSSQAQRVGGTDADPTTVAEKTLSTMIDIQPTESTPEAHLAISDPEQVSRILF